EFAVSCVHMHLDGWSSLTLCSVLPTQPFSNVLQVITVLDLDHPVHLGGTAHELNRARITHSIARVAVLGQVVHQNIWDRQSTRRLFGVVSRHVRSIVALRHEPTYQC